MNRTKNLLLLTALGGAAFAADINICSTGFATATTSGCGAPITSPSTNNLTADGNWYTASSSSGTQMGQAYVTVNNAAPLQNVGPWLANNANDINGVGAGSSWIVPSNNQSADYINSTYYFSTQFSLTSATAATASISGYWLADDYGAGIFLNGVSVGQSSLPAFGGLGGPMVPFNINEGNIQMGQAVFTGGTNVLTFGVVNDSTGLGTATCVQYNNCGSTPTGVRVLFTSATTGNGGFDSLPEPNTMLLMGGGLLAVGLMARRRKAKA